MKEIAYRIFFILFIIDVYSCKQQYFPPVIKSNLGYLVVDGIIISGNDSTVIRLSRTQNITDSAYIQKTETGAKVSVIGPNAETYPLTEESDGTYVAGQLNLDSTKPYQLKITTSNGNEYLSEPLSVETCPPIDSVSWKYSNDGVKIYVNTHDPTQKTNYYRWFYSETWEYRSAYDSYIIYDNGNMVQRNPDQHVYTCWKTISSTEMFLGSTANLTEDVIYEKLLTEIPKASEMIGIEYSISVNQYALTKEAYQYFQTLQKNTEQTGSVFDAQPSQLTGNIYNTANSNEPVLGFVSISSLQQQRIFIDNLSLTGWGYQPPSLSCGSFVVPPIPDSLDFYFSGPNYIPISEDYSGGFFKGYDASSAFCVDCTLKGGVNKKPAFWP